MQLGIAADHAGFELKGKLLARMLDAGYEVEDYGACSYDQTDDYPDRVAPLARAIADGRCDRGVIICGSGVGACVAANKVRGVRACLIHDTYSARQGVEHGALNVLCLGGRVIGEELAWEVTGAFIGARFGGEARHLRRVEKIARMESEFGKKDGSA